MDVLNSAGLKIYTVRPLKLKQSPLPSQRYRLDTQPHPLLI